MSAVAKPFLARESWCRKRDAPVFNTFTIKLNQLIYGGYLHPWQPWKTIAFSSIFREKIAASSLALYALVLTSLNCTALIQL